MNTTRTVAIVGAGYAGVLAANRLQASLTETERLSMSIVMVNPRAVFIDRIRLHQLAAGTTDAATIPLDHVLHPDVTVIVGEVTRILPERNGIVIDAAKGPIELPYDVLIYAVGSGAPPSIPGGASSHSVGTHDEALMAGAAVRRLVPGNRIVVVGGGATGVEMASELAEENPQMDIVLVSAGLLLSSLPQRGRKYVKSTLAFLNVQVVENERVVHVDMNFVELEGGRRIRSDLTIWTGSFTVPALARASALAVDAAGRLLVTETLQHQAYPNIIGAGDSVSVHGDAGKHLRMGCAVAAPMGGHAAVTALAYLRCQPPTALSIGFFIRCLSLGRRNGFVQHVGKDDVPKRVQLSGRAGAWVKERICVGVISGIQKERTSPGSYWTAPAPGARTFLRGARRLNQSRVVAGRKKAP
ncbi:NAD(P)/FAD-dependent oxidoreductase [Cryobacterium sp. TMT3-29-2]|uniref:NAD(P)/FAD-dependent oxidoreductase n=1 Tax=Cryobacterium sp. TMT3-29-2 TaxID=2555867 RepID=UPI00107458DB|nr:FAD-dependent oxidoreductase [Cryobacterium sp. TMT3-29-2]TFC92169.1 dehydrogenase [Cryobacterium sp. TMT3-29-2]